MSDVARAVSVCESHYVRPFGVEPGCSLLDAGCGDGVWAAAFAELGFTVTGVDISQDAIANARERFPRVGFVAADARDRDALRDSWDVIFCRAITTSAFPGSPENRAVMSALADRLASGGLFLFARYSDRTGIDKPDRNGTPIPQPPASEYVQMLERAGLDPFRMDVSGDLVIVGARASR